MQKIYEPGTTVRIVDHKDSRLYNTLGLAAREGWLWVVEGVEGKSKHGLSYICKSLATGETRGLFEVEMVDATQDSSAG